VALIGLDVSRPPLRFRTRSWAPAVLAIIVAGLFLAALRVDVTRMRLALGTAFKEELRLEEVERELTVAMRQLRDPANLALRATERGFVRAERLIDLDPVPPSRPRAPEATPIELANAHAGSRVRTATGSDASRPVRR
jgi:hypothetical protein